jgi:hypothetical protein
MKTETKFQRLVHFLNAMPLNKQMYQSALVREMPGSVKKTYKSYLGLLKKRRYIVKDGRGKEAIVARAKRIPKVKLQTSVVKRED